MSRLFRRLVEVATYIRGLGWKLSVLTRSSSSSSHWSSRTTLGPIKTLSFLFRSLIHLFQTIRGRRVTMPVHTFDEWAGERATALPLSTLSNACVGIEAAHYLTRLLNTPPTKEPLVSALGGVPLGLKRLIERDLEVMEGLRIKPLFVFSGMEYPVMEKPTEELREAARINAEAWGLYNQHKAVQAVETFGRSGAIKPERLTRFLQKILYDNKVEFLVAPYSSWAQLAYIERNPRQFVDAIMGSSELFLFDVDKLITRIDFETSQFFWLSKRDCQVGLGNISSDMFIDVCLLAGCSILPTFPPLENPTLYQNPVTIRDTTSMLLTLGRSVTAVCTHYQDEPQVQQSNYLDRYRRARLAVKHHVVINEDGRTEPLDVEHAPSDVHEFMGQRLPEELYFYLSRGVIGPRVLNWLASGELYEYPPLEEGESGDYQSFVRTQLDGYRVPALALLSQPLQRFYQRKEVVMRFWFSKDVEKTLGFKDLVPSSRDLISFWNVRETMFRERAGKIHNQPGTLTFAVRGLADSEFAAQTLIKKDPSKPLKSQDEIICNTLWRFLQMRGYVDEDHQLTHWGRALRASLAYLEANDNLEEPVFLAIELLRLGLLNAENTSTTAGAPFRGSDRDKASCLLISRVACVGKLRHKPIGFTGPLSRNLLAFHSYVDIIRESNRDLIEMVLANMLLNGDAHRDRGDWMELGLGLPFITQNDCALSICVKSYLDELAAQPDPKDAKYHALALSNGPEEWFSHCVNVAGDLKIAFRLWDAVLRGVKAAGKEIPQAEHWVEVDKWLSERRL